MVNATACDARVEEIVPPRKPNFFPKNFYFSISRKFVTSFSHAKSGPSDESRAKWGSKMCRLENDDVIFRAEKVARVMNQEWNEHEDTWKEKIWTGPNEISKMPLKFVERSRNLANARFLPLWMIKNFIQFYMIFINSKFHKIATLFQYWFLSNWSSPLQN